MANSKTVSTATPSSEERRQFAQKYTEEYLKQRFADS